MFQLDDSAIDYEALDNLVKFADNFDPLSELFGFILGFNDFDRNEKTAGILALIIAVLLLNND